MNSGTIWDLPWQVNVMFIAIIVDAVCCWKLLNWGADGETQFRRLFMILIPGVILYLVLGITWNTGISESGMTMQDPWGTNVASSNIVTAAVAASPGLLAATIYTYFKCQRELNKVDKKNRKRKKQERKEKQ